MNEDECAWLDGGKGQQSRLGCVYFERREAGSSRSVVNRNSYEAAKHWTQPVARLVSFPILPNEKPHYFKVPTA